MSVNFRKERVVDMFNHTTQVLKLNHHPINVISELSESALVQ